MRKVIIKKITLVSVFFETTSVQAAHYMIAQGCLNETIRERTAKIFGTSLSLKFIEWLMSWATVGYIDTTGTAKILLNPENLALGECTCTYYSSACRPTDPFSRGALYTAASRESKSDITARFRFQRRAVEETAKDLEREWEPLILRDSVLIRVFPG